LVNYMFLEVYPFLPGYSIWGHIIVYSTLSWPFLWCGYNVFSFISGCIDLSLSFFVSPHWAMSVLFIISTNYPHGTVHPLILFF
jgi:hypothetical protein